jgi:hypothetical protein
MSDPRQYSLRLIDRSYEGEVIRQRARDGYINATAMCKAAGREFKNYYANQTTKAFILELAAVAGIPATELVQIVTGGTPGLQGTWVHPQVATHLAQWLSPKFAVRVSQWVYEWLSGLGSPAETRRTSPVFVQRFNQNWDRVSPGYFSVISELFVRVYGRLEQLGHVLPDRGDDGRELRPDISVGKTFPAWLARHHPGLCDKYKLYRHILPNRLEIRAKEYHNSVLPAFIEFIEEHWLPNIAATYFKKRDTRALEFLPKLLTAPY